MELSERLNKEYIEAMKKKDTAKLTVLRLLKTAITNRLVELKQPQGKLEEDELQTLIIKQAKQRQDSIEQYIKAGREDLANKEEQELVILQAYLPRQLDEAETRKILLEEINLLEAKGMGDMGRVIGSVMGKYKGQVDGKKVSTLARELLSSM